MATKKSVAKSKVKPSASAKKVVKKPAIVSKAKAAKVVKKVAKKIVAKPSKKIVVKAVTKVATKLEKVTKPYTKSELYTVLAERHALTKTQISNIFNELIEIIKLHLHKDGPAKFVLPGLLKMNVKAVPATKARKGVNPFTGEPTVFKAKPASRKVKVAALKALKGFV